MNPIKYFLKLSLLTKVIIIIAFLAIIGIAIGVPILLKSKKNKKLITTTIPTTTTTIPTTTKQVYHMPIQHSYFNYFKMKQCTASLYSNIDGLNDSDLIYYMNTGRGRVDNDKTYYYKWFLNDNITSYLIIDDSQLNEIERPGIIAYTFDEINDLVKKKYDKKHIIGICANSVRQIITQGDTIISDKNYPISIENCVNLSSSLDIYIDSIQPIYFNGNGIKSTTILDNPNNINEDLYEWAASTNQLMKHLN